MKEFKPIAMRCNQQQYDEIKQILLNNNCWLNELNGTFDEYSYLVNNQGGKQKTVCNLNFNCIKDYNRTVFETWNKNTFLEYCGIETKTEWVPEVGDWVFTDMCNIENTISKNICVKVTQVDKIPDEQPNFMVEGPEGGRYWCYPNERNTSFVRKAEPHEIPNNNTISEYVECIKEWFGNEFKKSIIGKIYDTKVKSDFSIHDWNKMSNFNKYFKPSTKQAFDAQNNKTDFIVGKWYKYYKFYLRFLKEIDGQFMVSEWIDDKGNYKKDNSLHGTHRTKVLLTDLSEIQQYLPDNHPDKVSKKPDLHDLLVEATKRYPIGSIIKCLTNGKPELIETGFTIYRDMIIQDNKQGTRVYKHGEWAEIVSTVNLLEQAKLKYPIGTQFSPAHVLSGINVVTAEDYHWENDRKDCILVTSKSLKETWSGCLYKDGKWAAIIENVKPVETKSKYQIAAEKAMERFKDIQIGDKYITTSGYENTATRLPEITGDCKYCYIDCGSGYLWQYDNPKFGYKLVSQSRLQYPLTPKDAITVNPNVLIHGTGGYYDTSPSLFAALDYKSSLKEIQPTESITNQLLNIKLNNY